MSMDIDKLITGLLLSGATGWMAWITFDSYRHYRKYLDYVVETYGNWGEDRGKYSNYSVYRQLSTLTLFYYGLMGPILVIATLTVGLVTYTQWAKLL